MEQTPPPGSTSIRMVQKPRTFKYYIGPRGLIFFVLAILVLFLGFVGYLEYERLVKPYMEFYICCLPAGIIAGLLLFFGFATRVTRVGRVQVQPPTRIKKEMPKDSEPNDIPVQPGPEPGSDMGTGSRSGLRRYQPKDVSRGELIAQRRSLEQFLKNLDEQHRDKLITSDVYINLKSKYKRELSGLNSRLKTRSPSNGKKMKKIKVEDNNNL